MNLIDLPSPPETPIAQRIAESLLAHLNAELTRRVEAHKARFADFWQGDASPDDILAAMGDKAQLWLASASESVEHIATLASLAGKQLTDFLPAESFMPPREFVFGENGTVTLAPVTE